MHQIQEQSNPGLHLPQLTKAIKTSVKNKIKSCLGSGSGEMLLKVEKNYASS